MRGGPPPPPPPLPAASCRRSPAPFAARATVPAGFAQRAPACQAAATDTLELTEENVELVLDEVGAGTSAERCAVCVLASACEAKLKATAHLSYYWWRVWHLALLTC